MTSILAAILAATANSVTLSTPDPVVLVPGQTYVATYTVTNTDTRRWFLDSMDVNDHTRACGNDCVYVVPNPSSRQHVGWHNNPEAAIEPGATYPWSVTFIAGPGPATKNGVVSQLSVQAFIELDHKATGRFVLKMYPTVVVAAPRS